MANIQERFMIRRYAFSSIGMVHHAGYRNCPVVRILKAKNAEVHLDEFYNDERFQALMNRRKYICDFCLDWVSDNLRHVLKADIAGEIDAARVDIARYTPIWEKSCQGWLSSPCKATSKRGLDDQPMCKRHWNIHVRNLRIERWRQVKGMNCPEHPNTLTRLLGRGGYLIICTEKNCEWDVCVPEKIRWERDREGFEVLRDTHELAAF